MPNAAGAGLKKIRLKQRYFTPEDAMLATGLKSKIELLKRAWKGGAIVRGMALKGFDKIGRLSKHEVNFIEPDAVTRWAMERNVPHIDRERDVTKTDFTTEQGISLGKYARGFKAWRAGKIRWEKRLNEQGMLINALPRDGKELKKAIGDMGNREKEKAYKEMVKRKREKTLSKIGETLKIKDMLINHPRLGKMITMPRLLECHGINPSFGHVVAYSKEITEGWPTFRSGRRGIRYLKQGDPRINAAVERLGEFIEKAEGKVPLRGAASILNTSFGSVDLLVKLGKIPEDKVLKGKEFTLVDREYIGENRKFLRKEGVKARTDANWESGMAGKGIGLGTAKSIIALLRKRQKKLGEGKLSTMKIGKFIKSIQNNEAALKELHFLKKGERLKSTWGRGAEEKIVERLEKSPDNFKSIEAAFSQKLDRTILDGMLAHFDRLRNMNGAAYRERYSFPKIKLFMLAFSSQGNPRELLHRYDFVLRTVGGEERFHKVFDETVREVQRLQEQAKRKTKPIYSGLR